jgi:type IV secretory pathway VirB2 component (pilin)
VAITNLPIQGDLIPQNRCSIRVDESDLRMMTPPTQSNPAGGASPLSPDHLRTIEFVRVRSKKVRRAAAVAKGSGWTLAFFALVTLMGALFGDLTSLIMGLALVALAFNELRGGKMIARFDPRGARTLGINQLVLGAVIVSYAAWSFFVAMKNPALAQLGGTTGDPDIDATVQSISDLATYGLYGTLAVVGFIGCGLTALYYFTRAGVVRSIVAETPAWVLDTMRAAA